MFANPNQKSQAREVERPVETIQRRMKEGDMPLRLLTRKRVGQALKRLRNKGVVASRKAGRGALLAWRKKARRRP